MGNTRHSQGGEDQASGRGHRKKEMGCGARLSLEGSS